MYLIYYPLHAECNLVIAHIVPIHLTLHTLYSGYNTQCTPHILCMPIYSLYITEYCKAHLGADWCYAEVKLKFAEVNTASLR